MEGVGESYQHLQYEAEYDKCRESQVGAKHVHGRESPPLVMGRTKGGCGGQVVLE